MLLQRVVELEKLLESANQELQLSKAHTAELETQIISVRLECSRPHLSLMVW